MSSFFAISAAERPKASPCRSAGATETSAPRHAGASDGAAGLGSPAWGDGDPRTRLADTGSGAPRSERAQHLKARSIGVSGCCKPSPDENIRGADASLWAALRKKLHEIAISIRIWRRNGSRTALWIQPTQTRSMPRVTPSTQCRRCGLVTIWKSLLASRARLISRLIVCSASESPPRRGYVWHGEPHCRRSARVNKGTAGINDLTKLSLAPCRGPH